MMLNLRCQQNGEKDRFFTNTIPLDFIPPKEMEICIGDFENKSGFLPTSLFAKVTRNLIDPRVDPINHRIGIQIWVSYFVDPSEDWASVEKALSYAGWKPILQQENKGQNE